MSVKIRSVKFVLNILLLLGSTLENGAFEPRDFFMSNNLGFDVLNKFTNLPNDGVKVLKPTLCEKQLTIIKENIKQNQLWALKFIDAWANIPAGLLYGHDVEKGNFDECLSLSESLSDDTLIKGQYCLASLKLDSAAFENSTTVRKVEYLQLGICIPTACNASEAELLLKTYFETPSGSIWKSVLIKENQCTQKNRRPFRVLDWIAVSIVLLLGFLMSLGTLCDYFWTKEDKKFSKLLMAFSVRKSMRHLMEITSLSALPPTIIPALNGIRCLSMIWIIFTHSFLALIFGSNVNGGDIVSWKQTPYFWIWKNGGCAVDTFFFLSGMLLLSGAFHEIEKNSGKLNIPLMYLHRFLRLSPVLYMTVLLSITLLKHLAHGPTWNGIVYFENCDNMWWATLAYCLNHCWYLSADTQLYVLSPLALILLWKWRKWGVTVFTFIGLVLVIYLFALIYFNDVIVFETFADSDEFLHLVYLPTQTNTSAWIMGIIFAYFMRQHSEKRINLSKLTVFCCWFVSLALFSIVIFALYPKTQPGAKLITPLEGAFYMPLKHIAWPLGLCWLIFACVHDYAGPINALLSWPVWQPLAKLSYCMYIWHMPIVHFNTNNSRTNSHFSNYDAMLHFWSDFGITILISTVMYLAVEAPMLGIETAFLSKKSRRADANKQPLATFTRYNE